MVKELSTRTGNLRLRSAEVGTCGDKRFSVTEMSCRVAR